MAQRGRATRDGRRARHRGVGAPVDGCRRLSMSRKSDLALLGGVPVLTGGLPAYKSIGSRELAALQRVVEAGSLSGFLGSWGPEFDGGPFVREFEQAWCERF